MKLPYEYFLSKGFVLTNSRLDIPLKMVNKNVAVSISTYIKIEIMGRREVTLKIFDRRTSSTTIENWIKSKE